MTVSTEVLIARPSCQAARASLRAYVRADLSNGEAHRVSAHLECCRDCRVTYLELIDDDTAPHRLFQTLPVKAFLGTTVAALVIGGLGLGGLTMLAGAERSVDPGQVAVPPVASPQPATHGGGTAKPARRAHPMPTSAPQSTSTTAPASTSAPAAHPSHPAQPAHPAPTQTPSHGSEPGVAQSEDASSQPAKADLGEVDVGVTASRAGLGPASMVTVHVTGLAPTQAGVVTISSDQLTGTVELDPRCDLVSTGHASCQIAGGGDLILLTGSLPLSSTTLTITATPGDGLHDPSMDDNTTSIVLDGRV
jgi:hypothetical protein